MNLTQRVLYNTVVQVVGRGVSLAIALVSVRLTTNYLGVEAYGELAIVIALAWLLITVADLGITTTLAREVAKAPARATELGGDLLSFRLASAGAVVGLALAVVPLLPYTDRTRGGLAIALAWVFFASLARFPLAFFQTNLRLDYAAALDTGTKLVGFAGIALVVALDAGFHAVVLATVAANGVSCAAFFLVSRRFWQPNVRFRWRRTMPLMRNSIVIGLTSTIGLLHFRGDQILLSLLKPPAEVGIYSVAYRYIDQVFLLPGMFVATVFPIITRLLHERSPRADDAIERTFRFLLLVSIPLAVFLFVLARPLVLLVSNEEFADAARPLRILALALVFLFASTIFYNVVIALNRQRALLVVGIVALLLNVALNLVLIPPYSYMGAAVATLLSEGFVFAGTFVLARRAYRFRLRPGFLARVPLVAAAPAAVVALTWGRQDWLVLLLAEAAFAAAAFGLGAVTRADFTFLLGGRLRRTAP